MRQKSGFLFETFIIVRHVRSQNYRSARAFDANGLHSAGMTRQMMYCDAGGDYLLTIMKYNPVAIDQAHHIDHVIEVEGMAE